MTAFLAIAKEGSNIVLSEEMADTRCLGRRTRAGTIQREHNVMLYDWTLSHPVIRACNDIPRLQVLNSLAIARLQCHGTGSRYWDYRPTTVLDPESPWA